MARFAARTGRQYGLVEYQGAPDAERVIVLMGSGVGAASEAVESLVEGWREGRRAAGAALPALPDREAARGPARERPDDRRARSHQGAGGHGRAALPRRRHRPGRGRGPRQRARRCRAWSADATGCRPRSSRPPWSRRCSTSSTRRSRGPLHRRHHRRRQRHEPGRGSRRSRPSPTTCSGPCSTASAPMGRSAPTRTPSRSSARTRTSTCRRTSSTTRRSPGRRRCRTCASGRGRSGPPTWCARRSSSAVTSSSSSRRSTCSRWRRTGATLLLNSPHDAERGVGLPAAAGAGPHRRAQDGRLGHRRQQGRARRRARQPHQQRAADLLLRRLRRAAPRAGDREDQDGHREDLPQQGQGGRAQELRGGRSHARGARRRVEVPATATGSRQHAAHRGGRRTGVRAGRGGRRCWPGAAIGCR